MLLRAIVFFVLTLTVVSAQPSTYGLQIPASHPRLWWNAERLAQARAWYAANPFTPGADDYVGQALRYVLTGEPSYARSAINYAMNLTLNDSGVIPGSSGGQSNDARWHGEDVMLIYDWCWDRMTAAERSILIARWNGYMDVLNTKYYGGPHAPLNNYFWGYFRNQLEWAVTTWGENPHAPRLLAHNFDVRWAALLPYAASRAAGGIGFEGSQYGRYPLGYSVMPLTSYGLLGRQMFEESDYFKAAVYYLIYSTTPGQTRLRNDTTTGWEVFPFSDDQNHRYGKSAEGYEYGNYMAVAADLWRDLPVGQFARRWLNMVQPTRWRQVAAVDRGGNERDFASLPLDYFAAGPQTLLGRTAWGPQATAFHLQMGLTEGHEHDDTGNWQIWRNGRFLSRETVGYSSEILGYGSGGSVDVADASAHNTILVAGRGPRRGESVPSPVMQRLESRPQYAYAAVDLTPAYTTAGQVQREFLFVRPFETMIIFDRVRGASASDSKTFLAHFEQQPVADGRNTYLSTNGDQALRITTLAPANPVYRVVNEGGLYGQYRLEVDTSGQSQTYFLHVVQARDAVGANVTATLTETPTTYIVSLQHPTRGNARVEFARDGAAANGGFGWSGSSMPASVTPFTAGVQAMTLTQNGPVWSGAGTPLPPTPPQTASYTIAATAGAGGSIAPSGNISVTSGGSATFTITPQNGYRIANVIANGVSTAPVSTYTFANVTANQSISATFAAETPEIPPPSPGGSPGDVPMAVSTYAGNGPANLVSNAIPFKPGTLTDVQNFRILNGSNEVVLATRVLAVWPQDNSIRSVLVQFTAPSAGNYTLQIGSRRTTVDAASIPVSWDLPTRIFTLPASYLSESLVFWEQKPLGQTGFPAWDSKQLSRYSQIETVGTSSCVRDDHYYDAITTTYQMYARTGEIRYLLNARRWALHHRRDQIYLSGSSAGHPRCSGGYVNNTRYAFPQGLVQDYFMFGDEEAKRVSGLVVDSFFMDPNWNWWWYKAPGTRGFWTEREPAFALNGVLAQYEATGDVRYLNFAREKLVSLHRMQVENGGRAWVHNLYDHDPSEGCSSIDYGSSPWMSGLLLEGIVKYHKLTGDAIARESILMAVNDLRSRYVATGSHAGQSFVYLGCSAYRDGMPDLDNLISHAFAYAFRLTNDTSYATLATSLLNSSVQNGYTSTHKHFNQQFRSSGHTVAYLGSTSAQPPTDTAPPDAAVTAPTAGQTVSGTIACAATATDNVSVAGVQFLIDGQPYGAEDVSAPYSGSINATALSNGAHTVAARARDAAGNIGTSSPVTFTVSNTTADTILPTVAVTAPTAGQTVSGTIAATASASDNVGVAGVQFLIDGQPYGTEDVSAAYSVSVNTTALSNATHTIAARARDAAGNIATSSPVTFTVSNTTADRIPPTVAVTAPTGGQTVSGTLNVTASASDNVGVTGVQFLLDGAAYGAMDTVAPYTIALNSLNSGAHTVAARARDAAGNVTTSTTVAFSVSSGSAGSDRTAPVVSVTSPKLNEMINGGVYLTANATDNVRVAGVSFYIDGTLIDREDTSAPYSVAFNTKSIATYEVTTHQVVAVARDSAGNTTTSAPVSFRIKGR